MLTLCLVVSLCLVVEATPNFLFILADDLGYNDLGAYGAPTIRTPTIDRLAMEGIKFTQFYSAAPICTPSRGALLTGRLPIRSGLYTNYSYPDDLFWRVLYPSSAGCLPRTETTIAEALKAAGYYSALVGKWHVGSNIKGGCLPTQRGFDYFFGLPYSHEEGYPGPIPSAAIWPPVPLMRGLDILEQPADFSTITPRYTQEALNLLDQFATSRQPFFLHVAYEQPHVPLFASPGFIGKSLRGLFGDAVEEMDNSIGQIIEKLKSTGLAENTLVVFTSDNGAWINPSSGIPGSPGDPLAGGSNAPFTDGKGSTWEGGMREPAIAWWPGTIQPRFSTEVVTMMDFFPTFMQLANLTLPPSVVYDGKSLVPLLTGTNTTSPHNVFFYWREHILMAVRMGPWKAHWYTRSGFDSDAPVAHDPPLLFNVEFDPAERVPVNVTTVPEVLASLTAAYQQHIREVTVGVSQYEALDWSLIPCCHSTFNQTLFDEFFQKKEYSLAEWEYLGCVCQSSAGQF